jgi:hypothetical protein
VANGIKSGRELAALRSLFATRLPSGAFPTGRFFAAFASGFAVGPRAVAFVAFAGLDLGLGTLTPIGRQGAPYVVNFIDLSTDLLETLHQSRSVPYFEAACPGCLTEHDSGHV